MKKVILSFLTDWIVLCCIAIGCVFMTMALLGHVLPTGEGSGVSDAFRGNDAAIILFGVTSFPAMIGAWVVSLPFAKLVNQAAWPFYILSFLLQMTIYALLGKLLSVAVRSIIKRVP